jgi:hypothetical protein
MLPAAGDDDATAAILLFDLVTLLGNDDDAVDR